jgi:RNA polymerase sigma-70 factor, ECF subfamily
VNGRSDADLVRAVLGGEESAYAPLVARYQERLFRRALAMLGDTDAAADTVQEAFIRGYTGLAAADPERFGAWIHRILRNIALDELRSPRQRAVDFPPDLPSELQARADPARELDRRELGDAIGDALAALSPTVREAFVLKHVEGLSYDEMAALTGVAVGALKMRVKRAREALQALLQPVPRDPAA